MSKILKRAPLMAILAVALMLTQMGAVAASPGFLELEQGDQIEYELKEATSDMTYENLTGSPAGFTPPLPSNMSVGDKMIFTIALLSDDTTVHGIETYDPAGNYSNEYVYDATNMTDAIFYPNAFGLITGIWDSPWYSTWFTMDLYGGNLYSKIHYAPWLLTTDWDDHEDAWMDLLAFEQNVGYPADIWGLFGGFAGLVNVTASVDQDTSYTTPDDEEVDTVTFTMHAVYNSSAGATLENETGYFIEVEYDEATGQAVMQNITVRDYWNTTGYSSVHVLWEYEDSDVELGGSELHLLYIGIIAIVVIAAVAIVMYMKK